MKKIAFIISLLFLFGNNISAQNYNDRWMTNGYFPAGHFMKDSNDRWESRAGEVAFYMGLADLPSWRDSLAPKDIVRLRISMLPEYAHPLFITLTVGKNSGTLRLRRGNSIAGYVEHSTWYDMSDTGYVDVTERKNHGNVWVKGYTDDTVKTIDSALFRQLQSILHEANLPKHSHITCWGGFKPPYVIEFMDSNQYNAVYDECYDGALGKLAAMIVAMADSSCVDMVVHFPNKKNGIKPAEFPGGDKALQEFIMDNMRYPELALLDGEEADIHLDLIVERDGTVVYKDYYHKDEYGFYEEAKRIVSMMPRWQPAIKDGKKVRSSYTCNFRFKLPPNLQPRYGTPTLETSRDSSRWDNIITIYRRLLRHPQNQQYLYLLGMQYYDEFLLAAKPMSSPTSIDSSIHEILNKKNWDYYYDRTPIFKGAADSALHYFYLALTATDSVDIDKQIDMYLPIRQLESYLHLPHNTDNRLPYDTLPELHYPATYFVNAENFETLDSVTDYSLSLSDSYFWTGVMSSYLNAIEEPVLYRRSVNPGDTLLRFAFYPSFHPPLFFRVALTADSTKLYWTKLDFTVDEDSWQTTYYPKQGQKQLTKKQRQQISALLSELNVDHLKRIHYVPMNDGAQWCIERRTHSGFKAHFTNEAGEKYQALYDYLINLAGIEEDYSTGYYH